MSEETPEWRGYQNRIAALFRKLGLAVSVDAKTPGARGVHDVDVLVEMTVAGVHQRWVVECKNWKRPARKEQVLALSALVDDVGANVGFLFCEAGFQSGARAQASLSRIRLNTAADLEAVVPGAPHVATVPFLEVPEGRQVFVALRIGEHFTVEVPAIVDSGATISIVQSDFVDLDVDGWNLLSMVRIGLAGRVSQVYGPTRCRMTLPDAVGRTVSWDGLVYLAQDPALPCILGRQGFFEHFDLTIRSGFGVLEVAPVE